ncbi:hypothetical protein N431DRAFT_397057 [Stipitochalara longipes BDJ]|nr:hypothetical protein N431DRAFT_397057 [Stipitochalara longipes BDJ]
MHTTNEHPGDFILDVANTGTSLMTAFTKFLTYRKVSDNGLENLYATISITTSVLRELGVTINKHEKEFLVKDEITKSTTQQCKENFDKLLVFVAEADSQGIWKHDGMLGGQTVTSEVDPWFLITIGIGGWEEAEKFWKSLNNVRDTLLRIKDAVKYMILKDLKEKNLLEPVQIEELKQMAALLPHLVQNFEMAEKQKKEAAEVEARASNADIGTFPNLRRIDSDGFSDTTLPVNEMSGRRDFVKDIDCQSIYSDMSFGFKLLQNSEIVYEEWLLKYNGLNRSADRSYSFLGLKFKSFYEDPGFWSIHAELRSQAEMKEQHLFAAGGMPAAKHKEAMKKAVQTIPKDGGRQIDALLQERTDSCSDETVKRQWSVVAVRAQEKFPYSSSKKWGKDPLATNWLITIRGETVDSVERHRPYRREDPWGKRDTYGERSFSPRRRPYRENHNRITEVMPRHRRRPIIQEECHSWDPLPRRPMGDAVNEKTQTGTLVVAKLVSQDEAEEKLEKIWVEMNKGASPEMTF